MNKSDHLWAKCISFPGSLQHISSCLSSIQGFLPSPNLSLFFSLSLLHVFSFFYSISVQTSCYMSLENTQYSLLALNPLSFIFKCKNVFSVLATSTFLLDSLLKPIPTMFTAQPLHWNTCQVANGLHLTHSPNKSSLSSRLTHKQ